MKLKTAFLFSVILAFFLSILNFESIENMSLNLLFKIRGENRLSSSIIHITFNENNYYDYLIEKGNFKFPSISPSSKEPKSFAKNTENFFFWETETYINLLEKIEKFNPLLVVIIPTFPSTGEDSISFKKLSIPQRTSLEKLSRNIPVLWSSTINKDGTINSPPQFLTGKNIFFNNIFPDKDLYVRSAILQQNGVNSLPKAVFSNLKVRECFKNSNLNFYNNSFFINYGGIKKLKHDIPATSFLKSIDTGWKNVFKDKIVLIDIDTDLSKKYMIPYSDKDKKGLATVREIHSEALSSLIQKNPLVKSPSWITFLISFALSMISTIPFFFFPLMVSQLLTLLLIICFSIISIILFSIFSIWINTITPLISILLISLNMTIWKYITDDRERIKGIHEEIDALKGNFLSLISHNLKTPIAKIRALSSVLLNKGSENLNKEQKESMQNILRSSRDLTNYITNILNITRIESQRIKLNKSVCDVNVVIHHVVDKVRAFMDNKSIKFNLELEPIFSVEIDKDLFFQLFFSILENAVKYSPNNSTITIKSIETGKNLEISVKDEGVGISKEEINKIFNKFHRTKNIYTESITGTGLGLYLAKYFVELHGGEISVESQLGEGSIFKIKLPLT